MLSQNERERYSRQIMLFGEEGQERLKNATIFIAGAGGLGSPISIYLAVAGVGRIILVDKDTVERTNLNRQILHYDRDCRGGYRYDDRRDERARPRRGGRRDRRCDG